MTFLIHSMSEFSSLILPILGEVGPKHIVEIGSEHGGMTTVLNAWASENQAHLTSVDPQPSPLFVEWAKTAPNFSHMPEPSLEAIAKLSDVDCWFIDGDHNWYTVFNELHLIKQSCEKSGKPMLVFLHDVGWPCERRDMYYAPDRIPPAFRHPYSYTLGASLMHGTIENGGFRGMGSYAIAINEGGPKNGVLTAIEDFAQPYEDEVYFAFVPAVFGLGVLFSSNEVWSDDVNRFLLPYHNNSLLAKLEENRLQNYLRVIEMQDAFASLKK